MNLASFSKFINQGLRFRNAVAALPNESTTQKFNFNPYRCCFHTNLIFNAPLSPLLGPNTPRAPYRHPEF